jgi:predicted dehydrogenase
MTRPIRVGVIGVGYLGQHHARIYSELETAQLTAIVDADARRAGEIAAKFGGTVFTDLRDALGHADAFSIAAPTTAHHAIALACIRAGKDILIEKPIAATLDEADGIIEEARKHKVMVQVGHLERFNPAVLAVYPLIDKPVFFEAQRLSPFLGRGIDVDITLDLMIHDIDIILSILAHRDRSVEIKDIKASVARVLTPNIDEARAWLEFEGGAQALMTASRLAFEKVRQLKIYQGDSYLLVDYQNMSITRFFKDRAAIASEIIPVEKREPLKEELKDFIECITTGRHPLVSAIEGRTALKIAMAIGASMERAITEKG